MHIPAADSLRHERFGTMSEGDTTMAVQAYVKTDATDEHGAYHPKEYRSRPFPYMIRSTGTIAIEPFITGNTLNPLSEALIEYLSLLYKSAEQEQWVNEIQDFNTERLSKLDSSLAESFRVCITSDIPQTLFRLAYKNAQQYMEKKDHNNTLFNNPLQDIENNNRYNFAYLPQKQNVDEWTLKKSKFEDTDENNNQQISEVLWLRYKQNDITQERPLISYEQNIDWFAVMSSNVEYGDDNMTEASSELINDILNETTDTDGIKSLSPQNISKTRTREYLTASLGK